MPALPRRCLATPAVPPARETPMLLALGFIDSPEEILLVLGILLLLFGPSKLPQLGSSLGKSMRAFREGSRGEATADSDDNGSAKSTAPTSVATCPKCGASTGTGSQFCTRCGLKLG